MKKTLPALIAEKEELSRLVLNDEEGKLDEYLLEQWRGNELELKDKIDGYGWVIDNIKAEIEKLKHLKDIHVKRLQAAITRFENEEARLRKRLYENSEGKSLRGNEYSFHPYIGQTQSVDITKVEPEYMQYTLPKLTYKEYTLLQHIASRYKVAYETEQNLIDKLKNVKVSCGVSDLPEGHPALQKELRYDVRIT